MRHAFLGLWVASLAYAGAADTAQRMLAEKCAKCHGAGAKLSDLDVTTREGVLRGGKQGAAVKVGDAAASRLYQFVAEGKMPPGERLDAGTVSAVKEWINGGAQWSGSGAKSSGKYWAFQAPLKRTPPVSGVHPIDGFLLAKLREKGLGFNAKADHRTLIRRLYFGLTGLPPAPADYQQSYEQAVEKLLASPRYGERWGRHWLDVVRFGETDGGEHNFERMNAWPYRDWVIRSLNEDKPYDRFVREQIAGDVLAPEDPKMVAATGFLVAGPWDSVSAVLNKDETLREQARMDELDDMVTTTAHSFLALTLNCARCHDHKFDPIPTRDYYRMTAFFRGVGFGEREVGSAEARRKRDEYVKPLQRAVADLRKKLAEIEDPVRTRLLIGKLEALDRERAGEPRRLPLNAVWNRNVFAEVKAQKFRFVIGGGRKGKMPALEYLELLPARHRVTNWRVPKESNPDVDVPLEITLDGPRVVSEIRFASDAQRGSKDGLVSVYRLEAWVDGKWKEVCSSLDHVGAVEVDVPEVSSQEVEPLLAPEERTRRAEILKGLSELQNQINAGPKVEKLYAAAPKDLEKAWLLERGNVKRRVEELTPGVLSAVGGQVEAGGFGDGGKRRLALADWIANEKNPLTARVIVNRVWYLHFGNGIVNTPSDFGVNGDQPSHPELLDWLAVSFMENGWSLKWLQRQIVASAAYQQSPAMNEKAFAVDAGNRLLWRMPLKRMDAETLRDSILATTGNLNLAAGGPSFLLQKNAAHGSYIYKALDADGPEVWRRAVYRFVVRGGERIMMDSFDCPDPSVATPQRAVSNTPVQALTLLNNSFVVKQAGLLAARLDREAPGTGADRIQRAYQLLYGRSPAAAELARDGKFIAANSLAAWCRVMLNSNEFVYVP